MRRSLLLAYQADRQYLKFRWLILLFAGIYASQPVPAKVDVFQILLGQPLDPKLRHQGIQRRPVQTVEFGPGLLTLTHPVH